MTNDSEPTTPGEASPGSTATQSEGAAGASPAAGTPRAAAVVPARDDAGARGIPAWLKVGVIFFGLSGAVLYLLFGSDAGEAFQYSKPVGEVVSSPERFQGKQLRIEGMLTPGSVKFRESPCEWRFQIEKDGAAMPVRFPECVVPDTFRDDYGISVTVLGRLGPDRVFKASEVIPRCPSKYEEQLKSGKAMPKGMRHSGPGQPI